MSRKNIVLHQVADNQSLAASFNSEPTVINFLDNVAYQINVTTSDSEGTFTVQGSVDYQVSGVGGALINAGNWVDLSLGGGTPSVDAENDSILINLNQLPFAAVRIAYTSNVAGTGTCDIYILAKQNGG